MLLFHRNKMGRGISGYWHLLSINMSCMNIWHEDWIKIELLARRNECTIFVHTTNNIYNYLVIKYYFSLESTKYHKEVT